MTRADALRAPKAAVEAAYLAGFNSSGEGYNGEYPFQQRGRDPKDDADWIARRDAEIAALIAQEEA